MRRPPTRIKQRIERLANWYQSVGSNGHLHLPEEEPPLRDALFNVDQLEQHANVLAGLHELDERSAPDRLLERLDDNEQVLLDTYDLLAAAVERSYQITPAAEWLLDNFYAIEEQIRTARRHLPRSYSQELPRLAGGSTDGQPRVYAIAMELIAHADGNVDAVSLNAFLTVYQGVTPLKLGELWAIPIMLRLALIENLRRVAVRLASGCGDRDAATEWAGRMVQVVEQNPSDLILVLADMARAHSLLTSAFVAELTRHLHGQSPHFAFAQSWLEHRLSERGLNIGQLVQAESQSQAADQISIGNSITSLRVLAATDWRAFVEGQSIVESTLRNDPLGAYASMGVSTRDQYRHAVEGIARYCFMSECEVASEAVRLAQAGFAGLEEGKDGRLAHVGYYLIDKGRPMLEGSARMRAPMRARSERVIRRNPLFYYLAGVLLLTGSMVAGLAAWASARDVQTWALALTAAPAAMCAIQLAIGVVNWLVTLLIHPRMLPRMDFRKGIPPEHRTIVVIPTMLGSPQGIQEVLERLELHYIGNRDKHLHFALLTDLRDAPHAEMPNDDALVRQVREGIEALRQKYQGDRPEIFFLCHRPRRWNAHDSVWMGFERKRGKLNEFTTILRGGDRTCFSELHGDHSILSDIRYVITVDTDTHLPRDAARELVGAMAHPLNRPIIDAERHRVIDGYGILQPRVAISLPSASRSWFARLFAADSGLDPYTRAVSDVYQDLFDEGSFIGKGIYDVDAFEHTCARFPDNTVLSHDLIEGAYARSGLLSDVELFEDYPSRYLADASRRRRWIRGDWQIARWLLPRVPGCDGKSVANPLTGLSRWKIFDNLRRSLVPPAMLTFLLLGWFLPWSALAAGSTLFLFAVIAAPHALSLTADLARKPSDLGWDVHVRAFRPALARRTGQILYALVFLPHEAFISLDAIARTMTRVLWTRRRLLEWTTSSDADLHARTDLRGFYITMRPVVLAALFAGAWMALIRSESLSISIPLVALWLASPAIAWRISRTIVARPPRLSTKQHVFLRKLARKTWRYFEVFVSGEENWLPPDNYQEHPTARIAARTSPTNIGMALLANLSALDFGYSSAAQFLFRTQKTLATMGSMEKYRGHFYNWYDTRSLNPLAPMYVSTVDSGNLAMHLLILRQGLLAQIKAAILPRSAFEGLRDTANVLRETIDHAIAALEPALDNAPLLEAAQKVERIELELGQIPDTLSASGALLQELLLSASAMAVFDSRDPEINWWSRALQQTAVDHLNDALHIAPWMVIPVPPSALPNLDSVERVSRIGEIRDALTRLDSGPTLEQIAGLERSMLPLIDAVFVELRRDAPAGAAQCDAPEVFDWLTALRGSILDASSRAANRIRELVAASQQCLDLSNMDFTFLYDDDKDLLSIGYSVADRRLDTGYYDLLASEARAASYFAIAQGQVEQEHWFALRRMLTTSAGSPALLSWNGSMFEYLMPLLVMPTYENTLLDRTCRVIVRRQIDYAKQRGIPWGISESGYNTMDVHLNYQYRGFGVPGLGLKRGLVEDLVVAPYATFLALMIEPEASCRNLERLTAEGRQGAYGFYEAIDYTPSRLPRGVDGVTIRSFMAHHEGMSLLSLAYLLLDRPMQRRFEADPALRANQLLLQERIPRTTAPVFPHTVESSTSNAATAGVADPTRILLDPSSLSPEVHLLSNGHYHVMVNGAGSGYSRWNDLAVTRWREDPTLDGWGSFCYVRDVDSGKFWSVGYQPVLKSATSYEAIFAESKAEFRRRDDHIDTHTEISVSPEDDIELRRITLTNCSNRTRTIELTTYAEVVLAPSGQDLSHPAFSSLFVQTELHPSRQAILCTRRARSPEERPPWMFQVMTVRGEVTGKTWFETDRMKFVGRGRTLAAPAAMDRGARLSGSEGSVLDPIVSIRRTIIIEPNETARIDVVVGVCGSRETAIEMTEKYRDHRLADRVLELAWTHSQVELRHINATETDAQTYGKLAGSVIYAAPQFRTEPSIILRNRRSQSGLWGHGISGDLPIVLVRIRDHAKLELIRQVFQAHAYWRMKGLTVDVIIWNEDESVYRQDLHDTILELIAASPEAAFVDKPGGVFLRRGEQMPEEDRVLLLAAARVVLVDDAGSLREQVERRGRAEAAIAPFKPAAQRTQSVKPPKSPELDLKFFNGLGGFTPDGREYITILHPGQNTPAPWVNVIANPNFGTVVTESGGAYTWAENSHEFRLTPWSNDPIGGGNGEAFYLRDEESGRVWSPTPQPARGSNAYVIRHGFGYSIFEYEEDGIVSELTVYVAMDASVKFARLKIRNHSGRTRRLAATGYWELVLGELRCKTRMHITTEIDPISNAIFARNAYSNEFSGRISFVDTSETIHTITGDRSEFLGRNGSIADPAALRRARLSGRVGAGFDPCAAIQVPIQIANGEEKLIVFTLGSAESEEEARQIIERSHGVENAQGALDEVWRYWGHTLGVIHLETPDPAVNILANGWLTYQTLACRMWARTGFYQSGGAYGFRDQLQDVMSLHHAEPHLVREHVLRAAGRQFCEGDVQHWWHPHSGRGVRSRCSDDYLWLPYATCRYIEATGDMSVLNETVPFLEGRAVHREEEGYYDLPQISAESGTLYEHCVRAVNHGLRFGARGLPLMGSGDWNDGMNLVGAQGKGESVWLAFFLYDVLTRFAGISGRCGDAAFAAACLTEADALRHRTEDAAWDGHWYLRAFYDGGEVLGSTSNEECQIDSVSQSWAVLSGAGDPKRAKIAMDSVDRWLVRRDAQLIQLFDPPFDLSPLNPGYIKGYGPGIRENGGQYTHAAIWTAMAFAGLGDSQRLWELITLLNPITHSDSPKSAQRYRVEPYVVAADVYAAPPHTGRGGWTWYTGSSGWMYRLITESLVGLRLDVDTLVFTPCIPAEWKSLKIHYRYRETLYHITVQNPAGGKHVREITVDGINQPGKTIRLVENYGSHEVVITLG